MCLAWMIKKFEFWRIPILVLQILSNFIFPSYLLSYHKIVKCLAYTMKKFGALVWKGPPLWYLQNFVKFCFFFIFTYSEKFISTV